MWNPKIYQEYYKRKKEAELGGGISRIEKQHQSGKLTARERLTLLFDEGTFQEYNQLSESRPSDFGINKKKYAGDGVVTGYGKIYGKLVFASSQDFTISGGAGGEEYVNKICRILEKAIDVRAPFINLNDSGGARIDEGIVALSAYSGLFHLNTRASGLIPQIAVIMGNCAGGASYSPILCDMIFMVRETSQMYITGPQVIKEVTGEVIGMEELGGAALQSQVNGQAHFVYDSDEECLKAVRRMISYLPSNCDEFPSISESIPIDHSDKIQSIVPEDSRRPYDVKDVILTIVDENSFIESMESYAKNMVTGFAKIDGSTIAFIANQPKVLGGAIDCDAADKTSRFIRFCDCFNIPIVTLVDVPAFLPGIQQEKLGIIRHGAKLLYAFSEATVPKISLIMRKAYGGAYCAMNSKCLGADVVFAWPICEIAVMGASGAVNVIYRKQIAQADNPEEKRRELIDDYEKRYLTPYYAAARSFVDEVILPEDTRKKIAVTLEMLKNKTSTHIKKKHGNMPL